MCLDKWTVVPPETLAPGPKCPGAQLSALKKGTVVPPRNFSSGAQLSGGPTFCPEKRDSCTPETLAPNMCLEKWTVVPPDKLDSRAQLSAMKKGTGVPPETLALGPNCPGGPKFLSWKKKGQFYPGHFSSKYVP